MTRPRKPAPLRAIWGALLLAVALFWGFTAYSLVAWILMWSSVA
jgi:hypothetical protein